MTKFAGYFNRLNNYFLTKIITQPPGNIVNAIQFLIQLAKSVCSLDTNNLPDLNSLMLISSILNGSIMNRLSNYFSMLTEQEKDTIREINDIIAPDKNYKTMRSILSRREALPFLGLILSDLTFAMENETQLFQIETVGETLTKLAQIKWLVNFEVVQYQTNLLQFLDNYQPSDEDMLYYKSLRLQPRKSDILSLDDFLEDPAKVFTTLDEQYFNNNLIPNIVYRGELHPISQCGIQLTAWFYDKLCSFDHKTRISMR
ncbi:RasGEF domain-containing protein [Legionella pneumophila]|nr:RasGEF domain-containing protein [Legionella pneumophila]